jgi:predicted nuclease with TOPRIM domain
VANELYEALTQFYRDVIKPDFDDIREKMVTKADLEAVREEMATGLQAGLQAVRDEMATKSDLQAIREEMATKVDLDAVRAEMATKSDLQAVERGVQAELQAIRREMVTWPVLIRFHEYVIRPEIDDVRSKLAELATRDETFTQVDGIYVHLGRLEHEYHALIAAVRRLEVEMKQQNANMEVLRAEMFEVRKQILDLSQRVTNLENVLN